MPVKVITGQGVPKAAKVPTLSSIEAAQKLRQGIQHVLNVWKVHPGTSSWNSLDLKKRVEMERARAAQYAERVDLGIAKLEVALVHRRTKEARAHLSALVSNLSSERVRHERAHQQALSLPDNLGGTGGWFGLDVLVEWNNLAQCLHTADGIPQGREQNVLRAIIAILRANNMGDLEGMTQLVQEATAADPLTSEDEFEHEDNKQEGDDDETEEGDQPF